LVATNLAFILDAKSMEFVQPIRNWLAIPSERIVLFANYNFFFHILGFDIAAFFLLLLLLAIRSIS